REGHRPNVAGLRQAMDQIFGGHPTESVLRGTTHGFDALNELFGIDVAGGFRPAQRLVVFLKNNTRSIIPFLNGHELLLLYAASGCPLFCGFPQLVDRAAPTVSGNIVGRPEEVNETGDPPRCGEVSRPPYILRTERRAGLAWRQDSPAGR